VTSEAPASEGSERSARFAARGPLVGLLSGGLFAIGLALSGMTDPGKVLAFLDVAGAWDPTLAFVMGGAVGFHFLWLRFVAPRFDARVPSSRRAPTAAGIDARLVGGAAVFGVGWGLSGYCPGPALVTAAYGRSEALWFSLALLAGVGLFRALDRRRHAQLMPADAPSSGA
jgi:uncharacterized membrane protein YedE/YeeE